MDVEALKARYRTEVAVKAATAAVIERGLTVEEELALQRALPREASILDAGCGAGRVALGLWELNYRAVLGVDWSREMVGAARGLAKRLEYEVPFRVGDLRRTGFGAGLYDAVVVDGATGIEWRKVAIDVEVGRELTRLVRAGGFVLWGRGEEQVVLEGLREAGVGGQVEVTEGGAFWLARMGGF